MNFKNRKSIAGCKIGYAYVNNPEKHCKIYLYGNRRKWWIFGANRPNKKIGKAKLEFLDEEKEMAYYNFKKEIPLKRGKTYWIVIKEKKNWYATARRENNWWQDILWEIEKQWIKRRWR